MSQRKIKLLLFFFLIFAALGYCREYFFVHINNIMYMKYYNQSSVLPVPFLMKFFERFSYNTLYYSKYFYTIIWSLLFLFVNYIAIRKLTGKILFIKILLYAYFLLFSIAFISMTYSYVIKEQLQSDEYTLSRWLMGIAQSPLVCLILLASERLYEKTFPARHKVIDGKAD